VERILGKKIFLYGFIEWNQMKDFIHLVRHPSPEEQTAAYKDDALFM